MLGAQHYSIMTVERSNENNIYVNYFSTQFSQCIYCNTPIKSNQYKTKNGLIILFTFKELRSYIFNLKTPLLNENNENYS